MLVKKIKKGINFGLSKFDYKINRIQPQPKNKFSMFEALQRQKDRGLSIDYVIDVGASNGNWSRECLKYFSYAQYLLVEAQSGHEDSLVSFKQEFKNIDYVIAAAGKENGKIYFDNTGLFGGIASETKLEKNCIEVPVISPDEEIKKRNYQGSFLLKLDTHGFEIPILEGAKELIKKAELVVIEVYNYKLTNESLKFFEMCYYMETLGFSPIEMVDFMLRPHDESFWQMDIFFVPSNNKSFDYNAYK